MTITLELSPEQEARLQAKAADRGLTVQEYIIVAAGREPDNGEGAPSRGLPGDSTLALLARWRAEDATGDPEELTRRDAELRDLMSNLNASRAAAGERVPFSHELD